MATYTLSNLTVPENGTSGTPPNVAFSTYVGKLTVSSTNGGVTTYSSSTDFIVLGNGDVWGRSFDYETSSFKNLSLVTGYTTTYWSSGGLFSGSYYNVWKTTDSGVLTINITNVNEAPVAGTSVLSVAEKAAGAAAGKVVFTDPDAGDSLTYSVAGSQFAISSNGTLSLKPGVALDYETATVDPSGNHYVTATVTAKDKGGLATTADVRVTVTDINEAPTGITLSKAGVDENAPGAVVGKLIVTDPDEKSVFSYAVSDARFEVDAAGQLKLKAGIALDFETTPKLSVKVTATDQGQLSVTQTLAITTNNVNENPKPLPGKLSIAENLAGAVVGKVVFGDPDAGDRLTYSVDSPHFTISSDGTLSLRPGVALDYEAANLEDNAKPYVRATVTARDTGGLSAEGDVLVAITNVNEAPVAGKSTLSVAENAAGAVIGKVAFSDPDAGDSLTYSVKGSQFTISSGGVLSLKPGVALNYETATDMGKDGSRYVTATVTAKDKGGLATTADVRVIVADVNEAPTGVTLSNAKVVENTVGSVIGTLAPIDPDGRPGTFTFAVDDTRFAVDAKGTLSLKSGVSLDYETTKSVPLKITVTDPEGLQVVVPVKITVTNANDAPTSIALSKTTVAENAAGAIIGKLTTTDPDKDTVFSYVVANDSRFEVDAAGQLKLKAGVALDFETTPNLSLQVIATDPGQLSTNRTFAITTTNVNEAPVAGKSTPSVAENAAGAVIGKVAFSDPDAGDSLTYSVKGSQFTISSSGVLSLKPGVALNYETATIDTDGSRYVTATVTAKDRGGLAATTDVRVIVTDVNEAPTGITLTSNGIAENASGIRIGQLSAVDPDFTDRVTFSVADARFSVSDTGDLWLKAGSAFDFETTKSAKVAITATDRGGQSLTRDVSFAITNVNEAPTAITLSPAKVAENAAGAVIGTLAAGDPDAGDSFVWSVADTRFRIDSKGVLSLNPGQALDFETASSIPLVVTATDTGGLSLTKTVKIAVTNVNEAPIVTLRSPGSPLLAVKENVAGGKVGTVTITDPDKGDKLAWSVDDSRFVISPSGVLSLAPGKSLDFETTHSVAVKVTATDAGGLSVTAPVTVFVTDVNEAPSAVAVTAKPVQENAAGAILGTVAVTDPDEQTDFVYTLSDSRFEVTPAGVLKLKDGVALDFEAAKSVPLTIKATDPGGLSGSATVSVAVLDTPEAPTAIALSPAKVFENTWGIPIGKLTATDPDAGDTVTFSTDDVRFDIAADGTLSLAWFQGFDYEKAKTYSVAITATDSNGLSYTQALPISILNVNEAPGAPVAADVWTVAENVAGAKIGSVMTVDPDAGDGVTWTVDDARFTVTKAGVISLKPGIKLDFETAERIPLILTATDKGGLKTASEPLIVTVTDANDAPTGVTLTRTTVAENAGGAVVGILSAIDPDRTDSFTYTVSDSRFEIDAKTNALKLKSGVQLNYETTPTVNLSVTVTDSGKLTKAQPLVITVSDVNEAPTNISLTSNTVAENAPGASIGKLSVTDPDRTDTVTFKVSDSRFVIDTNGALSLKSGVAFDYEAEKVVPIVVTAIDKAGLTVEKAFTINVTNVNEAPTKIVLTPGTVAENAGGGTVVGTLKALDPDSGDSAKFTTSDARFVISDKGVMSLAPGVSFDFETVSAIPVTVTARDKSKAEFTSDVTVLIQNVNEKPTGVTLSSKTVAENSDGSFIGKLSTTDPDFGDTFKYTVNDKRFVVDSSGNLRLASGTALDYEVTPTVDVTVTSADKGGLKAAGTFRITVTDTNDAPTSLLLSGNKVPENAAGATIGTVTVRDQDAGDSFKFYVDDKRFDVNSAGVLRLKDGISLDYETVTSIPLKVTAIDRAGAAVSQSFAIAVQNVNEAPTGIQLLNATPVAENTKGAILGTLAVLDPDKGDTFKWAVADSRFQISKDGVLSLKSTASLDYEQNSSVGVSVTATDLGGQTITKTVSVDVTNVNETPGSLALSVQKVVENATYNVATITARDPDQDDALTYTVDDARFEIAGNTLRVKSPLDYETTKAVTVNVTATDKGGAAVTKAFKLDVIDANDRPTGLSLSAASVDEGKTGTTIGRLTVQDVDANDSFTYKVSDSRFSVTAAGYLTYSGKVPLDYETEKSLPLTITATDKGGESVAGTFTITVRDVNETPSYWWPVAKPVQENTTGVVLGTLAGGDQDANEKLTFLVNDSRFQIDSKGVLSLAPGKSLDFEAGRFVSPVVTVKDKGNLTQTITTSIEVLDVNEKPTDIAITNATVAENAPGAIIGALWGTDPDRGDSLTFSSATTGFEVDAAGNLVVSDASPLDFEKTPTIKVNVVATDKAGLLFTKALVIKVTDTNEGPYAITLTGTKVAENAAGANIGKITVRDPDAGDSFTYKVSDSRFEIDPVTGTLKLAAGVALDFEAGSAIPIDVTATDRSGLSKTQTLTVTVTNVNEQPTGITLQTPSVRENGAGVLVSNVRVADPDVGDTFTYKVNDDRFTISPTGVLALKAGVSLDYEVEKSVDLLISATDKGGLSRTDLVTLAVKDVNEAPTTLTLDTMKVPETNAGAVVGKVGATDPDGTTDFTWSVSDSRFTVADGVLRLKEGVYLDYEQAKTVTLKITAADPGRLSVVRTVTLDVQDINEAPLGITLSNPFVAENSAGAVIGTLGAIDFDAGDSAVFSTDDPRFEIDAQGVLKLRADTALDYEASLGAPVVVAITATDSGGLITTQQLTLKVTNVNEAPNNILLSNASVAENAKAAVVGTLTASDPDAGDLKTWSVSDDRFQISSKGVLSLKTGKSLDHEATDHVDLVVTVTDRGGLTATQTIAVSVTDVNEAPTAVALTTAGPVAEETAGAVIGVLSATDPDDGDSIVYSIVDSRFEIAGNVLKLKDSVSLDYETAKAVTAKVTATDSGGLVRQETFTLPVANINEAPRGITLSSLIVAENKAGTAIGKVAATDPEKDALTWSVNDERFEIANGSLRLKAGLKLDFETTPSVKLTLTVKDPLGAAASSDVVLTVGNIDEGVTAVVDQYSLITGRSLMVGAASGLIANDVFGDGGGRIAPISVGTFATVRGGSLTIAADGSFTYTPAAGFTGKDTFAYTAMDGDDDIAHQTVTFVVRSDMVSPVDLASIGAGDGGFVVTAPAMAPGITSMITIGPQSSAGRWASGAGDVNGDGLADFWLVTSRSAPLPDRPSSYGHQYEVAVVFGSATGSDVSLGDVNAGTGGFHITMGSLDRAIESVSALGDINGDGLTDLLIGTARSYYGSGSGTLLPQTYVVYGKADGAAVSLTDVAAGTGGFAITGTPGGQSATAGSLVSALGDVNGDGRADMAIFAAGASANGGYGNGAVYVVYGSDQPGPVDLEAVADGTGGFAIRSTIAWPALGDIAAVEAAGDVNGDGLADIMIAVPNWGVIWNADGLGTRGGAGAVLVVLGSKEGGSVDFTDPARVLRFTGAGTFDKPTSAGMAIDSAGDFNGDGLDDLVIGDPTATASGDGTEGAIYIAFGSRTPAATAGLDSLVEAGGGLKIVTTRGFSGFGNDFSGVSGIGDVNGDGYDDITIGGQRTVTMTNGLDQEYTIRENVSYVVFGRAGTAEITLADLDKGIGGFRISGGVAEVRAAGDVNGDGLADLVTTRSWAEQGQTAATIIYGQADWYANAGNRAPTAITISSTSVMENTPGAEIGKISGTDPDAGDRLTYTVADDRFTIVQSMLRLKDGILLDHEATPTLRLAITATDSGGLTHTEFVTVTVEDADEPVRLVDDSYRLAVGSAITVSAARGLLANDAVPDGGVRAVAAESVGHFTTERGGSVEIAADGSFVYTPPLVGPGEDGFRYKVTDADGASAWAHVDLTLTGYDLTALPATGGFQILGNPADFAVRDVAALGDVNNDGLADFAVEDTVIYGTRTPGTISLADIAAGKGGGFRITGAATNDLNQLTAAGDVNGDGFDDVLAGSRLIYGKADATAPTTGTAAGIAYAYNATSNSGRTFATSDWIDDVNDDGKPDLLLVSTAWRTSTSSFGEYRDQAFVLLSGSSSGAINIDSATGGWDNIFEGSTYYGSGYGSSQRLTGDVATGDFNADGRLDFALGVRSAENAGSTGSTFSVAVQLGQAADALGNITKSGYTISRATNYRTDESTDATVISAGDINGDGLDDVAIGLPYVSDPALTAAGTVYVVFGKTTTENVTLGDSFVFYGNKYSGSAGTPAGGFLIRGAETLGAAGFSVEGIGDVNGDGYGDLVIGAPGQSDASGATGAAYVVWGKASLDTINLADVAAGHGGFRISGLPGGRTGYDVTSPGDINGDGLADLVVSSDLAASGATGAAHVIFGTQEWMF